MDGETDSRRITLYSPEAFAGMRLAGRLAAEALDMIAEHVVPGVTTEALNTLCHDFMVEREAVPATLNYRGYPKSAGGWRYPQYRHHRDPRRLLRRHQPHVHRGLGEHAGEAAHRRDL
jgi:hypothetical protein